MSQPPAILRELFALLPTPGSSFPIERQAAWFRCFIEAANLVYGYVGDFDVTIEGPRPFRPSSYYGNACVGCPGRYPVPALYRPQNVSATESEKSSSSQGIPRHQTTKRRASKGSKTA
jgi:hypothetical protein